MEKVTIIGAGIGGLTTAIALTQKGIDYEIYESFSEFKDLGAGIMLANNAMQVFEKLGLDAELRAAGNTFYDLNIRTPEMKLLSKTSTTAFSPNAIDAVAIHRSKLQAVLLKHIAQDKLQLGKRIKAILPTSDGYDLTFEDGTSKKAEYVIGADGIHSVVRSVIYNDSVIRDAKQNCWRGIAPFVLPESNQEELNEIWGPGQRFGFVQIDSQRVYWYALKDANEKTTFSKNEIADLFSNYAPIVREIIAATPEEAILSNPITDLKPIDQWYNERICLVGDAAHATTPNLGQGACQSIEDAWVLASALAKANRPVDGYQNYQQKRMEKAKKVVSMSWRVGQLSHQSNPLLIGIRNWALRNTPKAFLKKQNRFLFTLAE